MSRALLALLTVRPNRAVPAGQLAEELWMGRPPSSAMGALRVHVAHLRGALRSGGAGDQPRIVAGTHGYELTTRPGQIDAQVFESELRAAREAADAGAVHEAATRLEVALGAWRGPAYDGMHELLPILGEAHRLEELRIGALLLLADANLALGRAAEVSRLLAPEVSTHPLNEGLAERLMRAQYRLGRPGESLRTYGRLRERLDDDLGISPGPSIRSLEEAIVLRSPELDAPRSRCRSTGGNVTDRPPFVGRRIELNILEECFEAAIAGRTQVAIIDGPAGIGKTRLLEEFADRVVARGGTTLWTRCHPERELGEQVVEQLGRGRMDPLTTKPRLLIIEDLHRAGPQALTHLDDLLRSAPDGVMIAATRCREQRPGARAPALAGGRLGDPDIMIHLDGLDVAELNAFVELGSPPHLRSRLSGDLDTLLDLTGGNPVLLREAIRALADAPDEADLAELDSPGARQFVQSRLELLSPTAERTITVAAVLGQQFTLPVLAAVADIPEAAVVDAADEAATLGLVRETAIDSFRFEQRIARNSIRTNVTRSKQARIHLSAACVLEQHRAVDDGPGWVDIARHRVAAQPLGDPSAAACAARKAGDEATEPTAAVGWYRQALELAGAAAWLPRERADTLVALAAVLERAGQRHEARGCLLDAATIARETSDNDLLADIAIAATPRYVIVDEFQPVHAGLVDEALRVLDDDPRRRASLLCSGSAAHYYDNGGDEPYAREALTLARSSTDPEVRATGLLTYHRWLTHDPRAGTERLRHSRELLESSRAAGLVDFTGRAYRTLLIDLLGVGDTDAFDAHLDAFEQFGLENQVPADRYWSAAFRATRRLMIDPTGEAEELVRAARRIGTQLQQSEAEGTFLLQMFTLRLEQRRVREVATSLEAPDPNQPRMIAGYSLAAAALLEAGRPDAARMILDRAIVDGQLRLPADNLWLGAAALYAGVAAAVGTAEQRATMTELLTPFADTWCVFGAGAAVFGLGHHWLGRLAAAERRSSASRRHRERAFSASRSAGATYWADVAEGELAHADRE